VLRVVVYVALRMVELLERNGRGLDQHSDAIHAFRLHGQRRRINEQEIETRHWSGPRPATRLLVPTRPPR
jgi:hypothetical protein